MRRTVYRVENEFREGPYTVKLQPESCMSVTRRHDTDLERWPTLDKDGMLRRSYHRSCFTSLEQLHNWFSDEDIALMAEDGFCVVSFDVVVGQESDKQALYREKDRR